MVNFSDSSDNQEKFSIGTAIRQYHNKKRNPTKDNFVISQGEQLFNAASLIIRCKVTSTIAVMLLSETKAHWLPTLPVRCGSSIKFTVTNFLKDLTQRCSNKHVFSEPIFLSCYKIHFNPPREYIQRALYVCEILPPYDGPTLFAQESRILWIPFVDSSIAAQSLWSNEILKEEILASTSWPLIEISIDSVYNQLMASDELCSFLRRINFDKNILTKLFMDWIQHTYPATTMNFYSFKVYMNALKWLQDGDESQLSYFNAFCVSQDDCLTLKDFILGLAAGDPKMVHSGAPGELRVEFLFRYYVTPKAYAMTPENVRNFVVDLLKTKIKDSTTNPSEEVIKEEMATFYKSFGVDQGQSVPFAQFAEAVRSLLIRGTSLLFRLRLSPFEDIQLRQLYPDTQKMHFNQYRTLTSSDLKQSNAYGNCARCRPKRYILPVHSVKIINGTICQPAQLPLVKCVDSSTKISRKMSLMNFDPSNPIQCLLERIREAQDVPLPVNFARKHPNMDFVQTVKDILLNVQEIFQCEPRILRVCSPCYIFGDIHGNLHDLLVLERTFWSMAPSCLTNNYLFLGDYVDRGEHSVECMLYLFCMKLLAPNRFFLLRGNHELRQVQNMFTFPTECQVKFRGVGNLIWEMFNTVFDYMPVSAVVDEQMFCSHGGIPASTTRLDILESQIPRCMQHPEQECKAVWEILWNDPLSKAEWDELLKLFKKLNVRKAPDGFLNNTRRGTAFFFGEESVKRFLKVNHLSMIIRAHEVQAPGYSVSFDGSVITIFSCSNYCQGNNEAAAILVKDKRVRIIRVHT